MKIALLGATGAVGSHFLTKALAAGYAVKALVRTPEKLRKHASLSVLKGDVTSPSGCGEGHSRCADVVVSCLGNVKGVLIMEKAARGNSVKPRLNKQSRQNVCIRQQHRVWRHVLGRQTDAANDRWAVEFRGL